MFFIVLSHATVHSDMPANSSALPVNDLILDWFTLGNLGVDIFVIISGYYLCTKRFKVRRILQLLTQVWFYSILGLIVALIMRYPMSFKDILKSVFPTIFVNYWFFTAYFVLIILSPFINAMLNAIGQRKHLLCIVVTLIMWSVIYMFTGQEMYGNEIAQFFMFYVIGAYFQKHPHNIFENKKFRVIFTIVLFLLLFLSPVSMRVVGTFVPAFTEASRRFFARESFLTIGIAIGLFSLAVYRRPFSNSFINTIGSCTFGVYLIHESPIIRHLIWIDIFKDARFYNSCLLVLVLLSSALIVFAVCTLIEYIRQKALAKPMTFAANKVYDFLTFAFHKRTENINFVKEADE